MFWMDACLPGELHVFSTFMFPLWLILAVQPAVRHLSSRRNVRQASSVCREWTRAIRCFKIKSTLCYRKLLQNEIVSLSWLMGINRLLMKTLTTGGGRCVDTLHGVLLHYWFLRVTALLALDCSNQTHEKLSSSCSAMNSASPWTSITFPPLYWVWVSVWSSRAQHSPCTLLSIFYKEQRLLNFY